MRKASLLGSIAALILLAYGGIRFVTSGLLPATRALTGDFAAVFPTAYFARLRPDFPTAQVWDGWLYGPMVHFLTLPLFLVPRWSLVPAVWALTNLAALTVSFALVCRLSGAARQVSWPVLTTLAALWLLFQPLATCFRCGNVEIIEMTLILAAIVGLQSKPRLSGVLIGVATMIKFLPLGFVGWFLLRRRWRAAAAAIATIAIIVAVTTVTLGWKESGLALRSGGVVESPQGGLHELSVTSSFLHRAGVLDYEVPVVRWFPSARALAAARAGSLASALLAAAFALVLFLRRRRPVSPFEVCVLFMTMFMILPWNHDYYYIFALVPVSVLFLRAAAARDWRLLTITIVAYLLISPPVPFSWIDKTGWFRLTFAYVLNYYDVPIVGALLLWVAATHQLLIQPDQATVPVGRWPTRRVLGLAVSAAAVAALAFLWFGRTGNAAPASVSALGLQPPARYAGGPTLALSPDGSRVAYIAETGVLCTRGVVDQSATTCWPEMPDANGPFFSPDGRWIGFFAAGGLKKAPAAGGAVQDIPGASAAHTATWDYDPALPEFGRDGRIMFASRDGIYSIAPSGGAPVLTVPTRPGDGIYASPSVVASGRTMLFTMTPREGGLAAIVAQSLTSGRRQRLLTGSQPHFDQRTRQLIYTLGGRVLAVPFNPETLVVSAVAVPLVGSVRVTIDGGAQFAVSEDGTLVYTPGGPSPSVSRQLLWVDRQGAAVPLPIRPNAFEAPRLSPDGRAVVATIRDVITDVWMYDLATGSPTRLTSGAPSSSTPAWNPDGRAVGFTIGGPIVLSTPVDAPDRPPVRLWETRPGLSNEPVRLSDWSRDGHLLAGTQRGDLWLLDLTKPGPPVPGTGTPPDQRVTGSQAFLIQTPFTERDPVFSPDGRWIAYSSDSSGSPEIYVRSYPGLDEPRRVTIDGSAGEPVWSRDGRELYFRRHDWVMAVSVSTAPTFTFGPARRLFEGKFATATVPARDYDVSPDGRHFLMVSRESQPPPVPREIRLLHNWPAKLRH